MNVKIKKVLSDMKKIEQKQLELQTKWNELNEQKTELENLEIIGVIRGAKINIDNLNDVIKAYQNSNGVPFSMKKEERQNDEI